MDSSIYNTYVAIYDAVPEEWEDARPMLVEILRRLTSSVNTKEIGNFLDTQLLTGQQFIAGINSTPTESPNQFRDIFRIVIDCGALPNASTISIPHGITIDINFSLMNLYLSATDPVGFTSFSVQYWSVAAGDIKLNLTSTDVVITTLSDYSNFTRSWAVIEFIQQL